MTALHRLDERPRGPGVPVLACGVTPCPRARERGEQGRGRPEVRAVAASSSLRARRSAPRSRCRTTSGGRQSATPNTRAATRPRSAFDELSPRSPRLLRAHPLPGLSRAHARHPRGHRGVPRAEHSFREPRRAARSRYLARPCRRRAQARARWPRGLLLRAELAALALARARRARVQRPRDFSPARTHLLLRVSSTAKPSWRASAWAGSRSHARSGSCRKCATDAPRAP